MNKSVLKSELAGSWYAADPEDLSRELDQYLAGIVPKPVGEVMALLLPHAGYQYSGRVAAHALKLLEGRSFSRVVVIGPTHRMPLTDVVSIPDVSCIETPLGQVEVDRGLAEQLWKKPFVQSISRVHTTEHSVQIELPLLQHVLGEFKVLPMVCGQLDAQSARTVASALLELIDEQTLVVISSDFTHFGHAFGYVPFENDVEENLRKLDMGAFRFVADKDVDGFLRYINESGATICGQSPIAVLLALLPAAAKVELLEYDTSGKMTGDWSHCVSYIAAAVSGRWAVEKDALSEVDKIQLLRLARHEITKRLDEQTADWTLEITPAMQLEMGAFVTLHKKGQLRGCIGEIFPSRPLYEAVAEQAVNAAFHDPRFPRLRADELDEVDLEISALTPPHRVDSYEQVEIGRHGVVLYKGARSAVFLPQVAPEQGWNLETTLSQLAMKAGLGSNDWKCGCDFDVFEAIVFGER